MSQIWGPPPKNNFGTIGLEAKSPNPRPIAVKPGGVARSGVSLR